MGWRSKNRSDSVCVCSKMSLRRRYMASWAATARIRPPSHMPRKPPAANASMISRSIASRVLSPSAIGPLMILPTCTAGISASVVPTKLNRQVSAILPRAASR